MTPQIDAVKRFAATHQASEDMAISHVALLERAAQGDERAFSELYSALAPAVYGIAVRVLRDSAQAEEVVQEVFVEVWHKAARADPIRGTGRAWVLSIARHRAVDRVRSCQKSRERDLRVGARDYPDPVDDVWTSVGQRAERERLQQAMAHLSGAQRRAIELAYFDGLTYREVAASLGAPVGTIKTRIRDGLRRLRATLGELEAA